METKLEGRLNVNLKRMPISVAEPMETEKDQRSPNNSFALKNVSYFM